MIMHAGEILRRRGLLSDEQLADSRDSDAASIVEAAIEKGFVDERIALERRLIDFGFAKINELQTDFLGKVRICNTSVLLKDFEDFSVEAIQIHLLHCIYCCRGDY